MTDLSQRRQIYRFPAGMRQKVKRLLSDRRGVAALEFAILAPILLCMYFMTMEASQAIETDKKVGRIGSMVADLVTQQQAIKKSELEAMMKIGSALLKPYGRSDPKIIVTGIQMTDEASPKAKVLWSRKLEKGSYSTPAVAGTEAKVPEKLLIRNTFLVRVESGLAYKPVLTYGAGGKSVGLASTFSDITMGETYYLRPRMTEVIACADC